MTTKRFLLKLYDKFTHASHQAFSRKYLLYTNLFLSTSISVVGDSLEQQYELHQEDIEAFDGKRTAHMGFSGFTAGIICHNWYIYLDKIITGRTFGMLMKKLLLDQFICSPVVILSFFATVAIFEESPWKNFNDEVKDKFLTLYVAEWTVWPPAQLINFYFLPTKFRVIYDNTISLGYDIYTSRVKHSSRYNEAISAIKEHEHEDHINKSETKEIK